MKHRIDKKEAELWQDVADKLRQAAQLVSDAQLILLLKLNITDKESRPLKFIDTVADNIAGGSYLFTPQSEWTGGDNFVVNLPHIARKFP